MNKFEIPEDVLQWINRIVEEDELEYADNYRAFRIKDLLGHSEYLKAHSRGCCGYMDTVVMDKNGDDWVAGCNYGH